VRTIRVNEIMTTPAWTLQAKETIRRARYLLRSRRIRYAPVLDGDRLVGILTESDLDTHLPSGAEEGGGNGEALEHLHVGDVMVNSPISIGPHHLVTDAARVMLEGDIGALPVVDGRRLIGIVTRTSLLQALFNCVEESRAVMAPSVNGS
jgi:CBS domain-containing protein